VVIVRAADDVLAERLAVEVFGDQTGGDPPRNQEPGSRNNSTREAHSAGRAREAEPKQEPELYELLRDHDEGRLVPATVELGELPDGATADMRRVADHVRLLLGIRIAAGELRPLPYAARWAARELGWREDYKRARRAIRMLVDTGVIRYVGELEPRGKGNGTKTYAAPLPADEGQSGEVGFEAVGPPQPVAEQGEHRRMGRAVAAERLHRIAAPGNAARGHGANANRDEGGRR
jgi:hypothetical protein